jgi:hypothetical protein
MAIPAHAVLPALELDHDQQAEPWGFPEWFLIAQTVLPAVLYLPGTQSFRTLLRILPFAISLAALAMHRRQSIRHPAEQLLLGAVLYLVIMIFHPTTNTLLAGLAQTALYLSVLAPLFWAPSMVGSADRLARLLVILMVCNGVNSFVGVMQVLDPGRWLPADFSEVYLARYDLDALSYIGNDGRRIIRPPGLFDSPGAVSGPAMTASLLGAALLFQPVGLYQRALGAFFAACGFAAIFLSQVRTSILITLGTFLVFGAILVLQRRVVKAGLFAAVGVGLVGVAWIYALGLGGEGMGQRFLSMHEDGIAKTYDVSLRAPMMYNAFTNMLPSYPFGAGLGRWGMMRVHFGDESNVLSPMIWSELQIPSWVLDGGIVLLVLYSLALLVTTFHQFFTACRSPNAGIRIWAAPVVASCAGTLVLVFGFAPFTAPIGMQYWFLAGALFGAYIHDNESSRYQALDAG